MIAYRFLLPAEEEMTEASQFYEAAASGLGVTFSSMYSTESITYANIRI